MKIGNDPGCRFRVEPISRNERTNLLDNRVRWYRCLFCGRFGSGKQHDDFALDASRFQMVNEVLKGHAQEFFVGFCHLAGQKDRPIAQHLADVVEHLSETVRGLEKNKGIGKVRERFELPSAVTSRCRQEPHKEESFHREAGYHQSRCERRRSGDGDDGYSLGVGTGDEHSSGIGKPWCAGIAHERHYRTFLQPMNQKPRALTFVMFVIADRWCPNPVSPQKLGRLTCVLARDQVSFLQNPERSKGHIFQIAYRCGNNVKCPRHPLALSPIF